jgi:hypothetical protein
MNNPKAPPSAKPITPDMTVFPGQDSITCDICKVDYQLIAHGIAPSSWSEERREGGWDEMGKRTAFTAIMVCSSAAGGPPPGGLKAGLFMLCRWGVEWDGGVQVK